MSIELRGNWNFPTKVRFGAGRISELPEVCRLTGIHAPFLVTDPGLSRLPIVEKTVELLSQAGIQVEVYSSVRSDPIGDNVREGVKAFRDGQHDGVIAMGGGSALDAGKVIALMTRQSRDLWAFEGQWSQISFDSIAPVISIPTTAGTGSEVGRAAVITHESQNIKKIILHPGMMPKHVIADPELTLSLPPKLTAATGMDALAHNFEALCAPFFHPMADGIAMEAMRIIHKWLPVAYKDGSNLEARSYMLAAATMGATAFQKGLGAIHSLSHPVGAEYHVHHGMCNAIVMPYVMKYNRPAIEEAMTRLATYLDLQNPGFEAVMDWILELRETIDIPHTLADVGVQADALEDMSVKAEADPCTPENPIEIDRTSLLEMYTDAFYGRVD